MLYRVTFTGIDDRTNVDKLVELSEKYQILDIMINSAKYLHPKHIIWTKPLKHRQPIRWISTKLDLILSLLL